MPQRDEPPVAPALTEFAWRQFWAAGRDEYLPRYFAHCDHHVAMAKHNDALPDGHPGKITREYAAACDEIAKVIDNFDDHRLYEMSHSPDEPDWAARFRALAAALRSILPPEPTDG